MDYFVVFCAMKGRKFQIKYVLKLSIFSLAR